MINIFKKITVIARSSVKFIVLAILSIFFILAAIAYFYNPTYAVSLNGEVIGYTENKSALQEKINKYISSNEEENVAFVQVDAMPTYKLCLLKKDVEINDDKIFSKITDNGTKYYKYYAVTDNKKEKVYVASFKEAEDIISQLKKKDSANIKDLGIVEKYDTSLKEFTSVKTSVSKLYEEKQVYVTTYASASASNYSSGRSSAKVDLGIALARPISGVITSRFGSNDSVRSHSHSGLDISAPRGTPIKAAAAGTVTFSGNAGDGYGYYVVIAHGNGVQTVYAHCSQVIAKKGQQVSQGEVIAKVGSTGNSTGNHLHLEVRKNGITYNPQYYVY